MTALIFTDTSEKRDRKRMYMCERIKLFKEREKMIFLPSYGNEIIYERNLNIRENVFKIKRKSLLRVTHVCFSCYFQ